MLFLSYRDKPCRLFPLSAQAIQSMVVYILVKGLSIRDGWSAMTCDGAFILEVWCVCVCVCVGIPIYGTLAHTRSLLG